MHTGRSLRTDLKTKMAKTSVTFPIILLLIVSGFAQTPRSIESTLLRRLEAIDRWSNYGQTPDFDKLEKENDALKADLIRFGRMPATLAYPFTKLKEKMYVVTSRDNRLRIYSWDRQTGGTMHDFDNVFQYRGKSGKVYTWTADDGDDAAGVFYHDLFQVDSRSGPIYLGVSTFIGSTSLAGAAIDAIIIDGEKLVPDAKRIRTASGMQNSIGFGYDFFSVVDRPERPIKLFKFDAVRKTFSFPVVIEDEKTPQGRVTNRLITYRFDGTNFVKAN